MKELYLSLKRLFFCTVVQGCVNDCPSKSTKMCARGEIVKMCVKVTHNYRVPTPQEDTFKFKKKNIKPPRNLTVRNYIKIPLSLKQQRHTKQNAASKGRKAGNQVTGTLNDPPTRESNSTNGLKVCSLGRQRR